LARCSRTIESRREFYTGCSRTHHAGKALRFGLSGHFKGGGFLLTQAGFLPPRDRSVILAFLATLSIAVLLVLCIACANVANLLLAKAAASAKIRGLSSSVRLHRAPAAIRLFWAMS